MAVAMFGAPAHFIFYFLFKYGFHLPYESFTLRVIASLLCLSALLKSRLPDALQPYFPFHWHLSMIFVLPFIFTVNLIMNNFHELWLYWEIFMLFVLIMFVPHWVMFFFDLCIGVLGAILFCLLSNPNLQLHPTFNIPLYSIVIIFSIFVGYAFSFSNWQSMKNEERQKAEEKNLALQALAGGIAHEMRNPLGQIRHNLEEILQELPVSSSENSFAPVTAKNIETINKRVAQAQMALNRGLHVIDMTLGNFRNDDVSREDFSCLSAAAATRKAIDEYGYATEQERQMVHLESSDDFLFKGDENSYILVIYNLLVNALHFIQPLPGGRIDIRMEQGKSVNRIFVRDNGPGISSENLNKIFDPFFTSGKKGGTGLGLAFCRRIMRSFGGDILCNSEKGNFTEFVMSFPVLDKSLIDDYEAKLYAEYRPVFSGKHLLIAGTSPDILTMIRRQVTPFGISTNEASDGAQVMNMIVSSRYDILLADIDLPFLNAAELSQKIRETGKDIPVVAYTTSKHPVPGKKLLETGDIDSWISMPPALSELLYTLKTSLETTRETLKESLAGKTVLVVDDLDFNRRVIKMMLSKLGVTILEASNGQDAIDKLKTNHCDLLIMDMRMPVLDGFEATRRIRSGITAYRSIPILGMSGNLDNASLKMARQSGMNECLIKPVKLKEFLQKIGSMLKNDTPHAL
ncbi:MAG: hybrid sensor histidine kinase/response regulator [Chlorobiaceae bacterium]|nr:hybrid sensor histidine kinase/response regulator [Chlorobiaceae bacterium]